jgi:hypothetical protein
MCQGKWLQLVIEIIKGGKKYCLLVIETIKGDK